MSKPIEQAPKPDWITDHEARLASKVIACLLDAGHQILVDPTGGEANCWHATALSADPIAVWNELFTTGEDYLITESGAFVSLIYGNGNAGLDVICDYSTSLETTLRPAFELAEFLSDGGAR